MDVTMFSMASNKKSELMLMRRMTAYSSFS